MHYAIKGTTHQLLTSFPTPKKIKSIMRKRATKFMRLPPLSDLGKSQIHTALSPWAERLFLTTCHKAANLSLLQVQGSPSKHPSQLYKRQKAKDKLLEFNSSLIIKNQIPCCMKNIKGIINMINNNKPYFSFFFSSIVH